MSAGSDLHVGSGLTNGNDGSKEPCPLFIWKMIWAWLPAGSSSGEPFVRQLGVMEYPCKPTYKPSTHFYQLAHVQSKRSVVLSGISAPPCEPAHICSP